MTSKIQQMIIIPPELTVTTLDLALPKLVPDFSRTEIQLWIKQAEITLNQQPLKTRYRVKGGETLVLNATPKVHPAYTPENIPLNIVFEDEFLIVINKPPGLVVHPGAGNQSNTLLNALLYHNPTLNTLPRAGIVHRLDKDTSGL